MKKLYTLSVLLLFAGYICSQDLPKYCLENDSVNHYLNDFSYDTIPDYNVSYIIDYYNKDASFRSDWPKPVSLSWTNDPDATAQYIEISDQSQMAESMVISLNKDINAYDVYNLIPGKTYYCRIMSVKDNDTTRVDSIVFETTGFLRMLRADGTLNVRDMGGWKGLGGNRIAYGKLFRGARLKEDGSTQAIITEQGIEYLRNAGIRAELDLRSSNNVPSSVSALAKKDANNKNDVDFLLVPESVNARMLHFDANNSNIREIQWIIKELKAGKPVYYHCSMGADRTGTLGFLLGALFGMSDGDLAKDYEITTFCSWYTGENSYEHPFARFRNYTGKWGSPDNNEKTKQEYMFAPVIDKLKTMDGLTTQRKIYNFLKKGVDNTKISANDLIWLIYYMTGYTVVDDIIIDGDDLMNLDKGQQVSLNAHTYPENPTNGTITYASSNPIVASVNDLGVITALTAGQATITIKADDCVKTVRVNVPKIESIYPSSATIAGEQYGLKTPINNKVSDGSFEYGNYGDWKNCAGSTLSGTGFTLKRYVEDQDSVYLESKIDGDETSEGSIRMEWITPKKRTYMLGFRIKNSTNLVTTQNPNLKVMLTTDGAPDDDPNATILGFPSYDGEWTEVQYIISTMSSYNRTRIIFTHLSQNGNNTCLDNFYLVELDTPSGFNAVERIGAQPEWAKAYDLKGREVDSNTRGLRIINGRKVLISE